MTGIEWTDETWNPVVGCSKVSAGCTNCYAEAIDKRFRGADFLPWHAGNAAANVRLHPERLEAPLHWRKPRRVFVNSMSDLFHEQVPDSFIDRVFAVMALCPQHTFQVLTKRPARMREYLADPNRHERIEETAGLAEVWPLPNVWLGTSVENQAAADERVPELVATPAAVRFLSVEPLLSEVVLTRLDCWRSPDGLDGEDWEQRPVLPGHMRGLHWVIVGGESGPGARPCNLAWIRNVRDQCQAAGVPLFVKQLGARPYTTVSEAMPYLSDASKRLLSAVADDLGTGYKLRLRDRKGGDPAEWPADLRVREWPQEVTHG